MPARIAVFLLSAAERKDEALAMAKTIIAKREKVPSPSVTAIKNEMRRLVETQEKTQENR